MKVVIATAVAALLCGGCSSSAPAARGTSAPSPTVSSSHTSAAPTGLTGFGASLAEWRAHHAANPDDRLSPGCCYGPPVRDPDNGGTNDTWNVPTGDDPIDNLEHHFPPGTSEEVALRAVAGDLPADARLVNHVRESDCSTYIYSSAQLDHATNLGADISVSLYSRPDGGYDVSDVHEAILTAGTSTTC